MIRPLALAAAVLLTPAIAACNDWLPPKAPSSDAPMSTVRYQCQQDKTIVADFLRASRAWEPTDAPFPAAVSWFS